MLAVGGKKNTGNLCLRTEWHVWKCFSLNNYTISCAARITRTKQTKTNKKQQTETIRKIGIVVHRLKQNVNSLWERWMDRVIFKIEFRLCEFRCERKINNDFEKYNVFFCSMQKRRRCNFIHFFFLCTLHLIIIKPAQPCEQHESSRSRPYLLGVI